MALQVGVIVEGQGEYEAIRTVLERIWYELLHGDSIEVMRPFRQKQGTLLKEEGLKAAVDAVKIKLGPEAADGSRKLVLILIDAESQCPKELAPPACLGGDRRHAPTPTLLASYPARCSRPGWWPPLPLLRV